MRNVRLYVASKTREAPRWLDLRTRAFGSVDIVSTWIYEAGEGETNDYSELATRCIEEIRRSDALVLYCEPGDVLKGALIEVGAALALEKPVVAVGWCASLSRVFRKHALWYDATSLDEAMITAQRLAKAQEGGEG